MTEAVPSETRKHVMQEFLASPEARILLLGTVMLVLWVAGIALLWQLDHPLWLDMLTVSFLCRASAMRLSIDKEWPS